MYGSLKGMLGALVYVGRREPLVAWPVEVIKVTGLEFHL